MSVTLGLYIDAMLALGIAPYEFPEPSVTMEDLEWIADDDSPKRRFGGNCSETGNMASRFRAAVRCA